MIEEKYEGKIIIAYLKPGSFANKIQGEIRKVYKNGVDVVTLGIGEIIFVPYKDIKRYGIYNAPAFPHHLFL